MDLPGYNFLPAPLWLVTTLHIVTLTLHFVAMNFLFGGMFVLLLGKIEDKWQNPVVQRFVGLFPTALAATVTLGVAPLLFLQLAYHKQAYAASIVSAWLWLFIVVAVIVAYYLLYGAAFAKNGGGRRVPVFLGVSLVLLAYVSWVYSTVFSMAERPGLYRALYAANQSGLVANPEAGMWGFRWLHMLSGAVTVGAFFVGLLGRNDPRVWKMARGFFVWGMAAAVVLGTAYMMTLGSALVPFMHSSGIWLTLVSLLLSLGALHFYFRRKFVPAAAMLFLSLLGMVVIRHVLRLIVLSGEFTPASIPVSPQWPVFLIFLLCFVAAIGTVWYMLRLLHNDRARANV